MTQPPTHCYLDVVTIEIGKPVVTKVIDHANDSDRSWLAKHIFWAIRNGCNVLLRTSSHN